MTTKKKKPLKLWVELEMEGDDLADANGLLNDILDNGVLQDALNDHDSEHCGPLKVTSALCVSEDPAGAALSALGKLLAVVDDVRDNSEDRYPSPDPGCFQCTAGTVPNQFNRGLCAYHAAKALLARQEVESSPR